MSKMVSVRLGDDLAEWVERYAEERGVSKTDLLASAVASFREDCKAGVPELRAAAARQSYVRATAERDPGVGVCPARPPGEKGPLGHVWAGWKEDNSNPCRFCGTSGREFFAQATSDRTDLFRRLRTPDSVKGIRKAKA